MKMFLFEGNSLKIRRRLAQGFVICPRFIKKTPDITFYFSPGIRKLIDSNVEGTQNSFVCILCFVSMTMKFYS
jgi:hypothetical protein